MGIIIKNDRLLLIHRQESGHDYYVLPGGGIEPEETAEEACRREIIEETGMKASTVRHVCSLDNQGNCEHYFRAKTVGDSPVLGGPEVTRSSDNNRYLFEWVAHDGLKDINLLPEAAKAICLRQLRSTEWNS